MLEKDICKDFWLQFTYLVQFNILKNVVGFHIPNERITSDKKAFAYYASLKSQGLVSGVFDYIFMRDDKVVFIEFKRNEKLSFSKHQKDFAERLSKANIPYLLTSSVDEAIDFLRDHFEVQR